MKSKAFKTILVRFGALLATVSLFVSCTGSGTNRADATGDPAYNSSSQYGSTTASTPYPSSSRTAPVVMDPCLIGTWKTVSIVSLNNGWVKQGGGGATVTFQADGLQMVDYTGMDPLSDGGEKPGRITWEGKSAAIISTADGKAHVIEGRGYDLTWEHITFYGSSGGKRQAKHQNRLPGDERADFLGPVGLGAVTPENQYICEGDFLTYESNTSASSGRMDDGSSTAAYTVKLRRAVNSNLNSR